MYVECSLFPYLAVCLLRRVNNLPINDPHDDVVKERAFRISDPLFRESTPPQKTINTELCYCFCCKPENKLPSEKSSSR